MPLSQFSQVEQNLKGLAQRVPDLPLVEMLVLRLALILGRDLNGCLDQMLKPFGLAEAEYRVMMALYSQGGSAFAGELCAALAQSPANLTRIGDVLVERGYVSRELHPEDRRRMLLSLKPAGEKLLSGILPCMSTNVAAAFEGFSAADKKRLLADLKRLLASVDALGARPQDQTGKVA